MRILQLLGAILILIGSPAMAKDAVAWIVTQTSGDVRVLRNNVRPASVQPRAALSPGDVVTTGANGRAMLTRGEDYVVVAPNSRLVLPNEEQKSGFTRLIQQVGTMLYKVRHTGVPHFAVETPMLAAVVKGTSFTVVVDKDRAAVQVTDGLVEVSSASGNAKRLVEHGVTVYVSRALPDVIVEFEPGTADLPAPGSDDATKIESGGDVPLSAITDLTGGLVREEPAAKAAVAAKPAAVADLTTPSRAAPAVTTPTVSTPTPGTPVVATPAVPTPALNTPPVTTPIVTVPTVTLPTATVPSVTLPAVTVPSITVPAVPVPAPTLPAVTVPSVTVPVVPVPAPTVPTVTVPSVTVPVMPVATPTVPIVPTAPTVTVPSVTVPVVPVQAPTVPAVPLPTPTVPALTLP